MSKDRFILLLTKYQEGTIEEPEYNEFVELVQTGDYDDLIKIDISSHLSKGAKHILWSSDRENRVLADVLDSGVEAPYSGPVPVPIQRRLGLWAAAAVILVAAGTSWWMLRDRDGQKEFTQQHSSNNRIPLNTNGVVVTLADGTTIDPDTLKEGWVARENGAVLRMENGKLLYQAAATSVADMAYNTITTSRGKEFQVTLPDGSNAWLNTASSLRYPVSFTGADRTVELQGEAYFDVAQHIGKPFKVIANKRSAIEVLGTEFNVNAYGDEQSVRATLVKGAVRVTNTEDGQSVQLKPNQQAVVAPVNHEAGVRGVTLVENANIAGVMAWRNGTFRFEGVPLDEVMKQLERWYDIEIVYENNKAPSGFEPGGEISRTVTLPNLILGLQEMGLSVRLEQRKLIISDKK